MSQQEHDKQMALKALAHFLNLPRPGRTLRLGRFRIKVWRA